MCPRFGVSLFLLLLFSLVFIASSCELKVKLPFTKARGLIWVTPRPGVTVAATDRWLHSELGDRRAPPLPSWDAPPTPHPGTGSYAVGTLDTGQDSETPHQGQEISAETGTAISAPPAMVPVKRAATKEHQRASSTGSTTRVPPLPLPHSPPI